MYLLLVFSDTRAGYLAFWISNIFFWIVIFFKKLYPKKEFFRMLIIINLFLILSSFVFGHSLDSLKNYLTPLFAKATTQTASTQAPSASSATTGLITQDITDSGKIRLLVWQGAIKAWEGNPLFGTGVETFAFAYYKYKLPAHNLTSEWDYLYNKAHNEYLNYLATTGLFGLGTYLGFIGIFFFVISKWYINRDSQKDKEAFRENAKPMATTIIILGIIAGYLTMLISNFFGFSVVIINLYVFLVPGFVFMLLGILKNQRPFIFPTNAAREKTANRAEPASLFQWTMIIIFFGIACWMIIGLIWFRQADIAYALGNNLDKVGEYKQAYPELIQAVQMESNEPTYKDELSINLAALGAILYSQKDTSQAAQVAQNAIALSNDVVTNHPNNVVFWKDRVRLFYTLSAGDTANAATYLKTAIQAIDTAKNLAPTDAKIAYNQGVLYGQIGELPQAIQMLNDTIKLKPNYSDAYIALGLFYHEAAIDKNGNVVNTAMQQKAVDTYNFILKHLDPTNSTVKKSLEQWRVSQ
jgi:O-antigen ligase